MSTVEIQPEILPPPQFQATVLADSQNPLGDRVLTFELIFPKFLLSQFNTHRMIARNAASSRAIPTARLSTEVLLNPFVPIHWGQNQPGMVAKDEVAEPEVSKAAWLGASGLALAAADEMAALGVHKQIANRVLEPYLWTAVIATGMEGAWRHFWSLRCEEDAQPEMQRIARFSYLAFQESHPRALIYGEWHLPFDLGNEVALPDRLAHSVASVARTSYRKQWAENKTQAEDQALHDQLRRHGHWSCFEQQLLCLRQSTRHGPFTGWYPYRYRFDDQYRDRWSPAPEVVKEWPEFGLFSAPVDKEVV